MCYLGYPNDTLAEFVYIKSMFRFLRISILFLMCCSSVAVAQLVSDTAKFQNNEKIWVLNPDSITGLPIPDSAFYMSAKLPQCMDLGNGCFGENFDYDKIKAGIEWDKCRNGDEDCYLTKNVKNAEPFVKALAQPFIYNHEKRERQSGGKSKK